MLCERCKKREANVIVTEVIDGVKKQHSYCMKCASEMKLGSLADFELPLGKLLSGILGLAAEETDAEPEELRSLACPSCAMTYGEFLRDSHFGCADCYATFGPLIERNMKKLQASGTHTGKHPKNKMSKTVAEDMKEKPKEVTPEEQIVLFQSRLKEALEEENYEDAALYRDKIRELKSALEETDDEKKSKN